MDCNCRVKVNLPPHAEAARLARHALDSVASGRARPEVLEDAGLLISEIVTNSVRHGHPPPDAHIHLSLSLSEEKLRAEVCDGGPGFSPEKIRRSPEQIGGWGLGIVQEVADRWGVDKNGGVCVWFEIDAPIPEDSSMGQSELAKT
ncbi:MAG TPA: ATP-binding protein [Actinomycetota bacterium]|nr:ATP-binding protein [Actinomycetota bacterium]